MTKTNFPQMPQIEICSFITKKEIKLEKYGEPAWPNDLLYIFPVVFLGTISCNVGLPVLEQSMVG